MSAYGVPTTFVSSTIGGPTTFLGYNGLLENDAIDFLKKAFRSLTERLTALYRKNNGKIGNVFFKISVDLGKLVGLNVAGLHRRNTFYDQYWQITRASCACNGL